MTDIQMRAPLQTDDPQAGQSQQAAGLLVVELRGLRALIETDGPPAAAAALFKFGTLVRSVTSRFPGAEIRSEGDSFYIVCRDPASALNIAIAILRDAGNGRATSGLGVACGISADAPSEETAGYLLASKLALAAPAGQALVSKAAREKIHDPEISFKSVGRILSPERIDRRAVFLVDPRPEAAPEPRYRRGRRIAIWVTGGAFAVLLVVGAGAWLLNRANAALPPGPWLIGAQLPLSGQSTAFGQGLQDSVQLEIDDINARGGVGGQQIALEAIDEGDFDDPDTASASIEALAGNDKVVAVVGPAWSTHGQIDIPVTNAAGLLMCSPANTAPDLTKPRFGALDLRSANPDKINYVRLATSDDIQGPAAARFAYGANSPGLPAVGIPSRSGLGARQALVIDDTTDGGRGAADSFQAAFKALGGTVDRRALNTGTTDFGVILSPLSGAANGEDVVYFGGTTLTGGPELRRAMVDAGYADVPLVSWDGLYDGSGADRGSYIQLTGEDAANTFITRPSIAPVRAEFKDRYFQTHDAQPNEFGAAAYACAQVIVDALERAAEAHVDAAGIREAVRAAAVNPATHFSTALGDVSFDANGDSMAQYVTLYAVDTGAQDGRGDWVFLDQQDYGPAD